MTKVESVRKFLNAFLGNNDVVIETDEAYGEDHEFAIIVNHSFIVGFYIPDKKWFVQKIISIPQTRDTPPDEDYAELISTPDFRKAMHTLAVGFADIALDVVGDHAEAEREDQWEREARDAASCLAGRDVHDAGGCSCKKGAR